MADRIEKLMQELDAERPAHPETQYDIGYNNGLTMAMAIARKFAKDTNVPSKWVAVTERLPKKNGSYLCHYRFRDYEVLTFTSVLQYYATDENPHFQHEDDVHGMKVTHWMPLPEAPKSAEGDGA